ncbi:MAG: hypothetical protein K5873_09085 [Treponema sp.]|nr:hypothetical protein [Treponema sp.]
MDKRYNKGDFKNPDSEKCFLGALLLDWSKMGEVTSQIKAEDFFFNCNQIIYRTMQELYGKVPETDITILINELTKKNLLEKAGGAAYLASLTDLVPTSANIDYYINQIKECRTNRSVKELAGNIDEKLASKTPSTEIIVQAKQKLEELQANSSPTHIFSASELLAEANERISYNIETQGMPRGISTGFDKFDTYLQGGLKRKHLIIIAARPSIGKTALALNLLENTAAKGFKSGFISLEMTTEELSNRLISQSSGVPREKLESGFMSEKQKEMWCRTSDYLSTLPLYIAEKHGIGINDVCGIIRNMVLKYGIQIIFIDYLGIIRPSGTGLPQHQELGIFSETIRNTSIELNIPIVLLCQLNRNAEDDEPKISELKGSGEIEQHADEVFLVHGQRESDPGNPIAERTIIIGKQRNGITGRLKMNYIGALTKFQEQA